MTTTFPQTLARACVSVRDVLNVLLSAVRHPAVLLVALTTMGVSLSQAAAPPVANIPATHVNRDFGKVPLSFEPNQGQTDPHVQFLSRGLGYALFLTPGEAVLELQKAAGKKTDVKGLPAPATLRMSLVGANAKAAVSGEELLPGTANYFIGNDSSKWHTSVPTYKRVAYTGVYPGVDLVYYGNQRELEYDFIVAPGADAAKIALQFTGATPVVDKTGDLVLSVQGEEARFQKPVIYQQDGDRRLSVEGSYQITEGRVGFALGAYDHAKALVIDPILSYLTYIGGSTNDLLNGLAIDSSGSVYVVARAYSADYPLKNAYQSTNAGLIIDTRNSAIAVSKFNPTGTALVYSTYLNGGLDSQGYGIAVDSSGDAYVVGGTSSADYPVTAKAFQTLCGANFTVPPGTYTAIRIPGCGSSTSTSGVVTKLNPAGTALAYSTFLSGDNFNTITAIAVDAAGQAYVTGLSNSNCGPGPYHPTGPGDNGQSCQPYFNFPITNGSAHDSANSSDGAAAGNTFSFLTKFNAAGSALLYSSILGVVGIPPYEQNVKGNAVAVDVSGNAYIGGMASRYLYTTAGAYQPVPGGTSGVRAFVAKFDTVAQKILYSSFISGTDNTSNANEQINGIAADAAGNAYLTGQTSQCTFPTTAGAYQTQASYPPGTVTSCDAGFVMKLNPTGTAPVWSTFVGNNPAPANNTTVLNAIALGPDGSVYVGGNITGGGFPTVNPILQTTNYAAPALVARLDPTGSKMLFASLISGSTSSDTITGIAVDATGNIYVGGQTNSNTMPVTPGAFQTTNKGNFTGFVAKIAPTATTTTALTLSTGTVTVGQSVKLTAVVTGQAGATGQPTGTVTFLSGSTTLGTGTLDATATATYTAASLNATTYNITASYAGDTAFSSSVSAVKSLVVSPATPTVTLTAPSTALVGASVTLAVVVAGTPGTPTGTVTFRDGTATLSTATLASGAATFSTTALTVGAHIITVSYAGDSIFAAATSAASTVTINVAPAITFAAQPPSLTITHGLTGNVVITGTPVGGYTGTVTFACGTLPSGASCSFAPSSLVFTSNNTAASTTLTFSTVTIVGALGSFPGRAVWSPVFAGLMLLPLGFVRRRKLLRGGVSACLVLLALVMGLGGCSSNSKGPSTITTPVGTYAVPVIVTAGTTVTTLVVSITVQ